MRLAPRLQGSKKAIVLRVRADPEPQDDVAVDRAKRAIAKPDSGGVNGQCGVDRLEMQARVMRVLAETTVRVTSSALDVTR